jgi:hypothetical protein
MNFMSLVIVLRQGVHSGKRCIIFSKTINPRLNSNLAATALRSCGLLRRRECIFWSFNVFNP